MEPLKKIAVHDGKFFYWGKGDLHTHLGVLKETDIKKAKEGSIVKSSMGKGFLIMDANFTDKMQRAKRGPQIMLPKDIGLVMTMVGLDKKSLVVDAGAGSLFTAAYLSNVAKKIVSYENREEFFQGAKHNLKYLGIKNIELKKGDVYKKISEKNVDLVILDVPEPWRAVLHAKKALKYGGYCVGYSPSINQVKAFAEALEKESFLLLKTCELIEREWFIETHRQRPKTEMIGHTGFLTFARKLEAAERGKKA